MIKICCAGKQGSGKTSVIKLLANTNYTTSGKPIITHYCPKNFKNIIDITNPKKSSFPQVEFSEVTIEENTQHLSKYNLNIYDIVIFIEFLGDLDNETLHTITKSYVQMIKSADINILSNRVEKLQKSLKFKHSEAESAELNSINSLINNLKTGEQVNFANLNKTAKMIVSTFGILSFKPICIFINTKSNNLSNRFEFTTIDGLGVCTFVCDFFLYTDLKQEETDNPKIFEEFGVEPLDLDNLLPQILNKCGFFHFYTIASSDLRAWQIKRGIKAVEAAGKIHKDFEKGFISAEIIKVRDFIELNGDIKKLKSSGKILQVNKDYEVQDEDIITFRFNV